MTLDLEPYVWYLNRKTFVGVIYKQLGNSRCDR